MEGPVPHPQSPYSVLVSVVLSETPYDYERTEGVSSTLLRNGKHKGPHSTAMVGSPVRLKRVVLWSSLRVTSGVDSWSRSPGRQVLTHHEPSQWDGTLTSGSPFQMGGLHRPGEPTQFLFGAGVGVPWAFSIGGSFSDWSGSPHYDRPHHYPSTRSLT